MLGGVSIKVLLEVGVPGGVEALVLGVPGGGLSSSEYGWKDKQDSVKWEYIVFLLLSRLQASESRATSLLLIHPSQTFCHILAILRRRLKDKGQQQNQEGTTNNNQVSWQ
jgi:hypothetical protein